MFCQAAGIECEAKEVSLAKGEHKTPEYIANVHKFGQVPAWKEDDESVYIESASILRFLANKYKKHEFWPEDLIERQKADAGLDFNGTTVRPGVSAALVQIVVAPAFFGAPAPSEEKKAELMKTLYETVDKIGKWLEGKHFIGGEKITLPDFQVFNELLNVIAFMGVDVSRNANVSAWWARLLEHPVFADANTRVREIAAKMAAGGQ